jgi:hypothetical protein
VAVEGGSGTGKRTEEERREAALGQQVFLGTLGTTSWKEDGGSNGFSGMVEGIDKNDMWAPLIMENSFSRVCWIILYNYMKPSIFTKG